jgi:SAM-dependent methyltransferase
MGPRLEALGLRVTGNIHPSQPRARVPWPIAPFELEEGFPFPPESFDAVTGFEVIDRSSSPPSCRRQAGGNRPRMQFSNPSYNGRSMLRMSVLRTLERWFPPMPSAYMEAEALTTHEVAKAPESVGRYLEELGRRDVDVLDFGCGWGGETLWLAERVRSVIGTDVDATSLAQADRALQESGRTNCRFVLGTASIPNASIDAIFSTDTFEHVQDLPAVFADLFRVLRPGGVLISRWGPLFYSPFGYHLRWACQVPYAHLVGGLDAVRALRLARAPQISDAHSWRELGLNQRVFADYQRAARGAGFTLARFRPLAVKGLTPLRTCLGSVGSLSSASTPGSKNAGS